MMILFWKIYFEEIDLNIEKVLCKMLFIVYFLIMVKYYKEF